MFSCLQQSKDATFSSHIHGTWGPKICRSLYSDYCILDINRLCGYYHYDIFIGIQARSYFFQESKVKLTSEEGTFLTDREQTTPEQIDAHQASSSIVKSDDVVWACLPFQNRHNYDAWFLLSTHVVMGAVIHDVPFNFKR